MMNYLVIENQNIEIIESTLNEVDFYHKGHIGEYVLGFLSEDYTELERKLMCEANKIRSQLNTDEASAFFHLIEGFEDYTIEAISQGKFEYNQLLIHWFNYDYFFKQEYDKQSYSIQFLKQYLEKCIAIKSWSEYETFILACELGYFPFPAHHLGHINIADYASNDNIDPFQSLMETKQNLQDNNQFLVTIYSCNNPRDIVYASLLEVFKTQYIIKKCANCNRYFIPYKRSDAIYCDSISPQDPERTCKEFGSQKLWYEKVKSNESQKMSRNIYMSKQMLTKRNPDIPQYRHVFEQYKSDLKKWKYEVKEGLRSEDEFIIWLKEIKDKKT